MCLEALWVKFIYEVHQVNVKVTGPKKVPDTCVSRQTASMQRKNSIANNSASVTLIAVRCACSIGFSGMGRCNDVTAVFLM